MTLRVPRRVVIPRARHPEARMDNSSVHHTDPLANLVRTPQKVAPAPPVGGSSTSITLQNAAPAAPPLWLPFRVPTMSIPRPSPHAKKRRHRGRHRHHDRSLRSSSHRYDRRSHKDDVSSGTDATSTSDSSSGSSTASGSPSCLSSSSSATLSPQAASHHRKAPPPQSASRKQSTVERKEPPKPNATSSSSFVSGFRMTRSVSCDPSNSSRDASADPPHREPSRSKKKRENDSPLGKSTKKGPDDSFAALFGLTPATPIRFNPAKYRDGLLEDYVQQQGAAFNNEQGQANAAAGRGSLRMSTNLHPHLVDSRMVADGPSAAAERHDDYAHKVLMQVANGALPPATPNVAGTGFHHHSVVLHFIDVCDRFGVPEETTAAHVQILVSAMRQAVEAYGELKRRRADERLQDYEASLSVSTSRPVGATTRSQTDGGALTGGSTSQPTPRRLTSPLPPAPRVTAVVDGSDGTGGSPRRSPIIYRESPVPIAVFADTRREQPSGPQTTAPARSTTEPAAAGGVASSRFKAAAGVVPSQSQQQKDRRVSKNVKRRTTSTSSAPRPSRTASASRGPRLSSGEASFVRPVARVSKDFVPLAAFAHTVNSIAKMAASPPDKPPSRGTREAWLLDLRPDVHSRHDVMDRAHHAPEAATVAVVSADAKTNGARPTAKGGARTPRAQVMRRLSTSTATADDDTAAADSDAPSGALSRQKKLKPTQGKDSAPAGSRVSSSRRRADVSAAAAANPIQRRGVETFPVEDFDEAEKWRQTRHLFPSPSPRRRRMGAPPEADASVEASRQGARPSWVIPTKTRTRPNYRPALLASDGEDAGHSGSVLSARRRSAGIASVPKGTPLDDIYKLKLPREYLRAAVQHNYAPSPRSRNAMSAGGSEARSTRSASGASRGANSTVNDSSVVGTEPRLPLAAAVTVTRVPGPEGQGTQCRATQQAADAWVADRFGGSRDHAELMPMTVRERGPNEQQEQLKEQDSDHNGAKESPFGAPSRPPPRAALTTAIDLGVPIRHEAETAPEEGTPFHAARSAGAPALPHTDDGPTPLTDDGDEAVEQPQRRGSLLFASTQGPTTHRRRTVSTIDDATETAPPVSSALVAVGDDPLPPPTSVAPFRRTRPSFVYDDASPECQRFLDDAWRMLNKAAAAVATRGRSLSVERETTPPPNTSPPPSYLAATTIVTRSPPAAALRPGVGRGPSWESAIAPAAETAPARRTNSSIVADDETPVRMAAPGKGSVVAPANPFPPAALPPASPLEDLHSPTAQPPSVSGGRRPHGPGSAHRHSSGSRHRGPSLMSFGYVSSSTSDDSQSDVDAIPSNEDILPPGPRGTGGVAGRQRPWLAAPKASSESPPPPRTVTVEIASPHALVATRAPSAPSEATGRRALSPAQAAVPAWLREHLALDDHFMSSAAARGPSHDADHFTMAGDDDTPRRGDAGTAMPSAAWALTSPTPTAWNNTVPAVSRHVSPPPPPPQAAQWRQVKSDGSTGIIPANLGNAVDQSYDFRSAEPSFPGEAQGAAASGWRRFGTDTSGADRSLLHEVRDDRPRNASLSTSTTRTDFSGVYARHDDSSSVGGGYRHRSASAVGLNRSTQPLNASGLGGVRQRFSPVKGRFAIPNAQGS